MHVQVRYRVLTIAAVAFAGGASATWAVVAFALGANLLAVFLAVAAVLLMLFATKVDEADEGPSVVVQSGLNNYVGPAVDWRCTNCGKVRSEAPFDGSWRWTGRAFQHACGGDATQAGHFDAVQVEGGR